MIAILLALVVQTPTQPMSCGTPVFHRMAQQVDAPVRPSTPKPYDPPEPGDTLTLWTWNMSVMPPTQFRAEFLVAGKGAHCYVMVHDSVWAAGIVDSAKVARIIERFDNSSPRDTNKGVWDHAVAELGEPPDMIDQDSLIYLIYYNIGTFMGTAFDGFWMAFDEYYDTTSMRVWGYHSNEIECVYLDCYPNDPSEDYRMAIAAHEFGHMIHWNYDPAESLWVQEGCCELVMWLYGAPDPVSGFPSNPDNDLTRWGGDWSDYIKTYLWFLYLYEQYGGRVGNDLIHNIIASPALSIAGINEGLQATGLPQRFDELLDDWVLANRVNDTGYLGGRYGYHGETVPRFAVAGYHYTYPVDRTGSLNRWAGEYLLFQDATDLQLTFDGADNADFRLFVVGLDTVGHRLLLDSVALDSVQYGEANLPGNEYQSVYLVPVSHHPASVQSYHYTAQASGIEDEAGGGRIRLRDEGGGLNKTILFGPELLQMDCRVLDIQGRDVTERKRLLSPGVYFVGEGPRGRGSKGSRVRKVILQR